MREVFYFIWWIYEGYPVVFYLCLTVLLLWIVYTHALAYHLGKKAQRKEDIDIIEKLEEDNSLGINTSERIATQYDVISGNYVEDDPIYN